MLLRPAQFAEVGTAALHGRHSAAHRFHRRLGYGLINVHHDLDKQTLPLMVERFAQPAGPPGTPLPEPIFHPRIRSTPGPDVASMVAADQKRTLAGQGYAVWLFGSPKDHAVAEETMQLAPGLCRNLCGTTSLGQAVDLPALAGTGLLSLPETERNRNAVEIESAISDLAIEPFDPAEFPFAYLGPDWSNQWRRDTVNTRI